MRTGNRVAVSNTKCPHSDGTQCRLLLLLLLLAAIIGRLWFSVSLSLALTLALSLSLSLRFVFDTAQSVFLPLPPATPSYPAFLFFLTLDCTPSGYGIWPAKIEDFRPTGLACEFANSVLRKLLLVQPPSPSLFCLILLLLILFLLLLLDLCSHAVPDFGVVAETHLPYHSWEESELLSLCLFLCLYERPDLGYYKS